MPGLTEREIRAATNLAEAVMDFLLAREDGIRQRYPESQPTPVEVRLPEWLEGKPPERLASAKPEPKPQAHDDAEQLVGVDKVGEILGCSARTVRRLADSGRLPRPRKIGNLVRWPIGEIRQWVRDGCPKQPSRR